MSILIIEDDARVASFLKRGLEAEGFGVKVARDGVSGLANALSADNRLIVLDLQIPGMTGLDICRDLRAKGVWTPILMLTAKDTLEDKVEGLRLGADDYMTKPFAFDELLARVHALIRRAGSMDLKPVRLTVADLVLDRDSLRVRRGERNLDLTSKEIALLDLLMSQPDKVISRERILSAVWGADIDPLTNVVDVYIGKLRRKIDAPGEAPLLQTVRGRGYRISAEAREE